MKEYQFFAIFVEFGPSQLLKKVEMRFDNTEKIGLNAVDSLFTKGGNWIFRLQTISDFGIDAHAERVINGDPKGRKIELQIKTGESHVKEQGEHFIFRFRDVHKNYWFGHQEPVLIIWYSTRLKKAFWEEICPSKVRKTKKGNKILIPKSNSLEISNLDERLDFILEKAAISKPSRSKFVSFVGQEYTSENLSLAKIEMARFDDMHYAITSINANQTRVEQVLLEVAAIAQNYRKLGLHKNDDRVLSTAKRLRDQLTWMAKRNSIYCDEFTASLPLWIGAYSFVILGLTFHNQLLSIDSELGQPQEAVGKLESLRESISSAIDGCNDSIDTFSDPSKDTPEDLQKGFEIYAESVWKLKLEFEAALEFIAEKSEAITSQLRKQGNV